MIDVFLRALENQIDRLIEPWAKEGSPGVAIAVVRGRELVANRHAGFASIEYGVPIGPATRFRIASVSKQFTCAAILLLADRGLLDIAAPACTLLPDLPDAYAAITIAQLMHNTSGIRDMLEIQRQGGGDLGTPLTASDLLAGIQRQRTLNFAPGTRYLYSNSNFFLLGLIVEKLSGLPLERFLEREIFAPLGMTATAHTPNVSVPVPHLATGYVEYEGRLIRAPHAFPLGGEGGLVSSVTDLAIWAVNARERGVPGPRVLDGLEQPTPFANGEANFYARGLITRRYRGIATLGHGGLWPGFRTEYLRVPGHDLAVIAIANHGSIDPNQLAYRVLDAMLDRFGVVSAPAMPEAGAVRRLAGRFLSPDSGATVDITVAEDGAVTLNTYGMPVAAAATEDGFVAVPRSSTVFAVRAIDDETIEVRLDAGTVERWVRVRDGAVLPDGLAGTYESEEMAARWVVRREADGGVVVRAHGPVVRGPEWRIEPITERDVRVHVPGTLMRGWLDVRIERDGTGAIAALIVSGGRAKAVRFGRT